jgi:MFS transporter, DHA2 family, multidrug resistance protein
MRPQVVIIVTAVLASLLEIIDTSIVNVAIPTMMGNLGATLEDISWVVTGYIIANAIVLPLAGWLGLRIGRKVYYTGCILLFTVTSVGCGLAPNLTVLVIFRVIQGLAGGALLPTSQALIQEAFPPEKVGMASAVYGMSIMIGPTIGPTLGGYLTDNLGWRAIFNINLPIGLAAAMMSYLYVEDIKMGRPGEIVDEKKAAALRAKAKEKIDSIGLALLIIGIGTFQYVLERGEGDDWFSSANIAISAIVAALTIPGFIWWELKTEHPIIDLRLFKAPAVRYGTILMTEVGFILYTLIFFTPVFAATVLGLTATQTGELFIPGALASAAMMPFIGMQLRKRDPRLLILVGITLLEIALVGMSHWNGLSNTQSLFWPLLIRGAAMAYLFVPINTVVLGQFSGPALGQVAGLLNLFRQLGGSIGIAALSTVFTQYRAQAYVDVTSHVSMLNPMTAQTLMASRAGLESRGASFGLQPATTGALKALSGRIQKQVFVIGFEQIMMTTFFLFFIALIPLFFLKPKKGATGPIEMH